MKAECTWGQGPDVLVTLDGTGVLCYEDPHSKNKCTHGIVNQGSLDLTIKEARILAASLIMAANQAEELNNSFDDYMSKEIDSNADL